VKQAQEFHFSVMRTMVSSLKEKTSDMDTIGKNKQIVREFTRTFKNEHNVDAIGHLFAPNFQHHFEQPVAPGLAGFQEVGRMMNRVFPDVVVTEDDLIAGEDKVVERSSAVATHRASMINEPPTNKQIRWTEIHIYRIENGKIAEHWVEMSMLELLKQIGAA
jgi:predicted ester cyclase